MHPRFLAHAFVRFCARSGFKCLGMCLCKKPLPMSRDYFSRPDIACHLWSFRALVIVSCLDAAVASHPWRPVRNGALLTCKSLCYCQSVLKAVITLYVLDPASGIWDLDPVFSILEAECWVPDPRSRKIQNHVSKDQDPGSWVNIQ